MKFGVKFYFDDAASVELAEAIPIFHRWIRLKRVPGLLIDVADYRHVPEGPGVMLVGHEADYVLDSAEGPLGLLYLRKRLGQGSVQDRLRDAIRTALTACRTFEQEPSTQARFRGDAMRIVINDRLGDVDLRPALEPLLETLYAGQACSVTEEDRDPRDRRCFSVQTPQAVDVDTLLGRV